MRQRAVIYTKFGYFELVGSEQGIYSVKRLDYETEITEDLPKVLRKCAQQLNAYFAGKRKAFDLKLDWSGATTFNKKVWRVLLQVPYGHTIAYGKIAKLIKNPQAYQAVGLANKHNPIAIIVPCQMSFAIQGKLF